MARRQNIICALVVIAIVGAAGIYWFGPQHLFLTERVDEALPTAAVAGGSTDPGGAGSALEPGTGDDGEPSAPTILSSGEFRSLEHETSGAVSILELEDGTRFLRIEDLDTLSGPDLRVYLSEAPADADPGALNDAFIDLGGLKGNQGSHNYEIPQDSDLSEIASVSIWCRRFSVGFGVAPLASAR